MYGRRKKKLNEEYNEGLNFEDPLSDIQVNFQCYGVQRTASIYFNTTGEQCWTKAWFNGREKGEPSIEITRKLAIAFQDDTLTKDEWLTRFYPKQMLACQKAVEQTRKQILGY